jgi:Domain of unknown function (DUF4336)
MRDLGGGVWVVDFPLSIAGMDIGARMTLLRLADDTLALHSPVALDDRLTAEIRALGTVSAIVAPNLLHYKYVPDAKARFPEAKVLAVPGLREKRPDLPIDATLETLPGIDIVWVKGAPRMGEAILFHRASRTLVVTDFVFHYPDPKGLLLRFYLWLTKSRGVPAQTLSVRALIRDRDGARTTRDQLLALDPERITVTHGEVILSGGRQAIETATAWLAR